MKRKLYLFLAVAMFLPYMIFAATQGKIRGKVVDSQTGEPLVGAAVIVVGTPFGATTDVNGEYQILKLEVGTYSLKSSYIGYQTITLSNIRVNADLTSEANFKLPAEGVAVPTVLVVAERPLINKSATNSVRIIDNDQITNLPVRGVESAVRLQPGVVARGTDLYIRGARADETGFVVDGVPATNKLAGGRAVNFSSEVVEQIQVQAGGYSAEYGNANGGLVISQLRTGSEQWKASLMAETDNFTKQGKKALGGYSYGYSDVVGTIGGPIFSNKIRFFGSVQNTFYRDPTQRFWEGFNFPNLISAPALSAAHPTTTAADTISPVYQPGNRYGGLNNSWTGVATLLYNAGDMQVRASGSYTKQQSRTTADPRFILDAARLPLNDFANGFGSMKLTHFVTPAINYEASVYYTTRSLDAQDPYFKDNLNAYGDSVANAKAGYTLRNNGLDFRDWQIFGGDVVFTQPGTPLSGNIYRYDRQREQKIGGRLDFSVVEGRNTIKFGGEYNTYWISRYSPGDLLERYLIVSDSTLTQEERDIQMRTLGDGTDNYGYDVWGNKISGNIVAPNGTVTDLGPRRPVEAALYAQDKLELEDINVNVGLRYDYISTDGLSLNNPRNSQFDEKYKVIATSSYKKTPAAQYVSPRIGFSFPVTDRTVFHAQYNKLVSSTKFRDSYLGLGRSYAHVKGGLFYNGNLVGGWGLKPERTTQYEIGFSQQISDVASFDLTTFYRDIQDQIQFAQIQPEDGATQGNYPTLVNGDYSTTKGMEFRLTMRRINRVQAQISYTYSDARGTGSNPNSLAGAVAASGQPNFIPKFIFPVDFNQAHTGNVSVDYRYGKDEGGMILSDAGLNLLLNFASGYSFTRVGIAELSQTDPRSRTPLEQIGASTTPWTFRLDLRVDKTVSLGPVDANFYVYVQNLLNTENVTAVWGRTGNAYDDGWLSSSKGQNRVATYGQQYADVYSAYNQGLNGDNFATPRVIRFGVKLEY
ncbi:MAG: TonB-dependent receptor [Acidobacteriota bacterium]